MIDFSLIYKTYAERWRRYFSTQIKNRMEWDNTKKYSPIAASTKIASAQKGIKRRADSRMNATGDYQKNAVVALSTATELRIGLNRNAHLGGSISYDKITQYNDADSPIRNRDIKDPPRLFPVRKDIAKLETLPLYSRMVQDMATAVEIQSGQKIQQLFGKPIIITMR